MTLPTGWTDAERAALRREFFGVFPLERWCDAQGEPRGALIDAAHGLVWREFERADPARARAALQRLARTCQHTPTVAEIAAAVSASMGGPSTDPRAPGLWRPPVLTAQEAARSDAIRRWAEGLDDAAHDRLRAKGTRRRFAAWAARDLRVFAFGRALLLEVAQRTEPALLPLSLREDVDTRGRGGAGNGQSAMGNRKARTA